MESRGSLGLSRDFELWDSKGPSHFNTKRWWTEGVCVELRGSLTQVSGKNLWNWYHSVFLKILNLCELSELFECFALFFVMKAKKNTVRAFLFCYFSNQNEKITQRLQNNLTLLSDVKKLSNYIEMVSTKNDQIFAIKFCFFSSENFIWVFLLPFTACSTWVKLNLRNTEKQFNIRIFKDFFSIWDFLSLIWKLMESQPNQEPFCLGLSLTRLTLVSYKL